MEKPLAVTGMILFSLLCAPAFGHDEGEASTEAGFDQLDSDRNGYLSRDEIRAQPEVTRGMSIYRYGSVELADVNGDGQLDQAEFAAFEELLPVE